MKFGTSIIDLYAIWGKIKIKIMRKPMLWERRKDLKNGKVKYQERKLLLVVKEVKHISMTERLMITDYHIFIVSHYTQLSNRKGICQWTNNHFEWVRSIIHPSFGIRSLDRVTISINIIKCRYIGTPNVRRRE